MIFLPQKHPPATRQPNKSVVYLIIIKQFININCLPLPIYDNMLILKFCQLFFYFFSKKGGLIVQKRYAVIGHPLGHTMSPFIHSRLFALSSVDAVYEAIPTPPENLSQTINLLKEYDGFNITIPHKTAVLPFLNDITPEGRLYGAVNTVKVQGGKLIGHSTDAEGFACALSLADIPIQGSVLILGCGGASRTIATECAKRGLDITLAVRQSSMQKGLALAKELETQFGKKVPCTDILSPMGSFSLAVNGTPVGMHPNPDASPLTADQLKNIDFVFDAVYNPEDTLLIKTAAALNKKAVSGMGMLVMQAVAAHKFWYGATFSDSDIALIIKDANDEMRRLFND